MLASLAEGGTFRSFVHVPPKALVSPECRMCLIFLRLDNIFTRKDNMIKLECDNIKLKCL